MTLQPALLPDDRLEIGFASLHFWPLLSATLNKPIEQLPKKKEIRIVVASNNYLLTEATDPLTQFWSSGNGWQNSAGEFLRETTGISLEFNFEVIFGHFLKCSMHTGPLQKLLLHDWSKSRVIREQVVSPLLFYGQRPIFLNFLQGPIYQVGQFAIRPVPIITTWGLLCNELVFVWNKNIHASEWCNYIGTKRNTTHILPEIPTTYWKLGYN